METIALENTDLLFFVQANCSWIGKSNNISPLGCLTDSLMDLVILRGENAGCCSLLGMLLDMDDGAYFNQDGEIKAGSGVEYFKATQYVLDPHTKSPFPDGFEPTQD